MMAKSTLLCIYHMNVWVLVIFHVLFCFVVVLMAACLFLAPPAPSGLAIEGAKRSNVNTTSKSHSLAEVIRAGRKLRNSFLYR